MDRDQGRAEEVQVHARLSRAWPVYPYACTVMKVLLVDSDKLPIAPMSVTHLTPRIIYHVLPNSVVLN